ncbi:MAG: luciferase family protein [Candidatus Binatia bacterium]
MIAAERARPHHVLPDSGWLTVPIRTRDDLSDVIDIFRMNYARSWI